jgi:hypothetical protein
MRVPRSVSRLTRGTCVLKIGGSAHRYADRQRLHQVGLIIERVR